MNTKHRLSKPGMDAPPPQRRWMALLCLMLLVLVPQAHSVLQHGLSAQLLHVGAPAASPVVCEHPQLTEDDTPCTLCSVLSSATKLPDHQVARPVEPALRLAPAKERAFIAQTRCFDQFCRPPPSGPLGESAAG